jgi:hypothetical protein
MKTIIRISLLFWLSVILVISCANHSDYGTYAGSADFTLVMLVTSGHDVTITLPEKLIHKFDVTPDDLGLNFAATTNRKNNEKNNTNFRTDIANDRL